MKSYVIWSPFICLASSLVTAPTSQLLISSGILAFLLFLKYIRDTSFFDPLHVLFDKREGERFYYYYLILLECL